MPVTCSRPSAGRDCSWRQAPPGFPLMIGPVWWAAGHSIVMVGLMLVAVESVLFMVNTLLLRRVGGITAGRLWNAVAAPLPAAAGMAVVMVVLVRLLAGLPAPAVLAVTLAAGLPVYVLGLKFSAPALFESGTALVRSIRGRPTPDDDAAGPPSRHGAAITVLVMMGLAPVIAVAEGLRRALTKNEIAEEADDSASRMEGSP